MAAHNDAVASLGMSASSSDWERAREQALEVLSRRARDRDTITYKEFARKIKAIPDVRYHGDERLDRLLDEVALDEDAAGRGLISVLVVLAAFPSLPSDGFYELAETRHAPGTPRGTIFEIERDRVFAAWANDDNSSGDSVQGH